jgi:hypothetical protein
VLKALGTALVGLGITISSTFAPSLGLSTHAQRIGFVVGVLLASVGGIVFLHEWRAASSEAGRDTSVAVADVSHGVSPQTTPASQVRAVRERLDPGETPARRADFVSTSINPALQRLHTIQRGKTHLQATALVALAIGEPIQFEGDVYSVSTHHAVNSVGFEFVDYSVFAHFDPEDAGPLMALNRGDRVVVRGELAFAEPGAFTVGHAKLLGVSPYADLPVDQEPGL